MPDALTQTTTLPAPLTVTLLKPGIPARAASPRTAKPRKAAASKPTAAKKGKGTKPTKVDKAAKLAPLARKLETRWAASLPAPQEKAGPDFTPLPPPPPPG